MGKLPDSWLDQLKTKINIVDVIGKYVKLNPKTGNNYFACCPFHKEKTPSFCVNENGQFYYCFSCHAGGDAIGFVKEMENISFMEAVKLLADKAMLELPELSDNENIIEFKKEKEGLLSLLLATAKHYNENLLNHKNAEVAREYLAKRNVDATLIKRFGLGFALDGDETIKHLAKLGFSDEQMAKGGILEVKNFKRDALATRVIFPIIDSLNQVIAFGGRSLDKNNFAKYKNTKETPLFEKGNNLYAINLVKRLKQEVGLESLIIVEGYMDVIALHKGNIKNVVAGMGTALTIAQIKLIKRYTTKVFVCYDGDKAGQQATLRGLNLMRSEGLDIKVVVLPVGLDPDDVIQKFGRQKFVELIDEALPFTEYLIKQIASKFNLSKNEERAKFAFEAVEELNKLPNIAEREVYLPLVESICKISIEVLRRQMFEGGSAPEIAKVSKLVDSTEKNAHTEAIRFILYAMIKEKGYVDYAIDFSPYIHNQMHYKIYEYIIKTKALNNAVTASGLMAIDEIEYEVNLILNNANKGLGEDSEKMYYNDCVNLIKSVDEQVLRQNLFKLYNDEIETDRKKQILNEIQKLVNNKNK